MLSLLRINFYFLALFLQLTLLGCLELGAPEMIQKEKNSYPAIRYRNISPGLSTIPITINIGENCESVDFVVPRHISSEPSETTFHFYWMLDNQILEQDTIEPSDSHQVRYVKLTFSRDTLHSFFRHRPPQDLSSKKYLLKFYVANKPYILPETGYLTEGGLENFIYWIIQFRDSACEN